MAEENLVLGIDVGTTSVKVCVFDMNEQKVVAKYSKDTQSNAPSDQGTAGNKQDVPTIISALNTCVAKFHKDVLRKIKKIGVCGQMHGIMLWDNTDARAWDRIVRDGVLVRYDVVQNRVTALYTWQDSRCDQEFLRSLPKVESHLAVFSGYGIATLFWMTKYKPDKIAKFNCAGTIQDFVVSILCNLDKPIMSEQNAASWGYFDCCTRQWNMSILEQGGFPVQFLPKVVKSGDIVGTLADDWHSIPKGTPIGVALGDLQCSVLATMKLPTDAALNISTSAQLAFVVENYQPKCSPLFSSPIEYFPYFNNKYIAVAASLNGGNILALFVQMLQKWNMDLGCSISQSRIWEQLLHLGADENAVSDLRINPTVLGERHQPGISASVTNVNIGNLGLGQVFRALCRGLIANLHLMMPKDLLLQANITRIVGNGSGLSRNQILQAEVQEIYELPLVFTEGSDAAIGAAMAVANSA